MDQGHYCKYNIARQVLQADGIRNNRKDKTEGR